MITHIKSGYQRKIKIANRIRFSIFISIIFMLIFPAIMYAVNKPMPKAPTQDSSYRVSVEAGDTLWDIAKAYLPPKTDIRNFVHEIKSVNGLESSLIRDGDTLYIPYKP